MQTAVRFIPVAISGIVVNTLTGFVMNRVSGYIIMGIGLLASIVRHPSRSYVRTISRTSTGSTDDIRFPRWRLSVLDDDALHLDLRR